MTFRIAALLGALVLWLAGLGAANAQAAQPEPLRPVVRCTSLGGIDLARATSATTAVSLLHEEGNGASAYCRVVGTIAPAVTFEVHLPLAGWTQRYLQTGCGGLCGSLNIRTDKAEGCAPVTDGTIAVASTDMGHRGTDTAWGDDPQRRRDLRGGQAHARLVPARTLYARRIEAAAARIADQPVASGAGLDRRSVERRQVPRDQQRLAIRRGVGARQPEMVERVLHAEVQRGRTRGDPIEVPREALRLDQCFAPAV